MHNKKAQLAVFVLIGIVICVAFGIFYFASQNIKSSKEIPSEAIMSQSIESYVKSCFDFTSKNAVFLIGRYGGYLYPDINVNEISTDFGKATYLYDENNPNGKKWLLSIEEMQQEISYYVQGEIRNCVDFEIFRKQGYEIEEGIPEVTSVIRDSSVLLKMDYPITAIRGSTSISLNSFQNVVDIQLGRIVKTAENIIESVEYSENEADIALIAETGGSLQNNPLFSYNFLFRIVTKMETEWAFLNDRISTLWVIYDRKANPEYMFIFATRHKKII
ncbi:MAG: hypothetical protein NTV63_04655 [Candidatus Woesearchaeota archaeon]|nr:hypothetical protein [Candidatus Woesearchaeota archaeon]